MSALAIARSISIEEFERMIEAGAFHSDARVELFRGELVEMPPPGAEHSSCVYYLQLTLQELLGRSVHVWVQSTLKLSEQGSTVVPDVMLLKWRNDLYRTALPKPEDVFLVIEVSFSTLEYDQSKKAPLYAEVGIPEYWIINLADQRVEVYSDPLKGRYQNVRHLMRGETLNLSGDLQVTLSVSDILG